MRSMSMLAISTFMNKECFFVLVPVVFTICDVISHVAFLFVRAQINFSWLQMWLCDSCSGELTGEKFGQIVLH